MTDETPDVAFGSLPAHFDVAGCRCLVDVRRTAGAPSHFVGYVDVPDDVDGTAAAEFLEAPGGVTYVAEDRVGFDTNHAYKLNVDDDGEPLPSSTNIIEARHESEMTTRYTAQDVAEATADLARAVRRISEGTPHYE